jgi:hypothetical protein
VQPHQAEKNGICLMRLRDNRSRSSGCDVPDRSRLFTDEEMAELKPVRIGIDSMVAWHSEASPSGDTEEFNAFCGRFFLLSEG